MKELDQPPNMQEKENLKESDFVFIVTNVAFACSKCLLHCKKKKQTTIEKAT